jgi:polyisoprenoid-binding protein YceI
MKQQGPLTLLVIIGLLGLLLAACGGDAAPQEAEPAVQENTVDLPLVAAGEDESAAPTAGMETYVIVPAESRASYLVDEEFLENSLAKLGIEAGQKDVVGSTQKVEGQLQIDPETMSLGENSFTVDLSTLESDQDRRDNWIRDNGPNFNRFPTAAFTATSLNGLPDSYVAGQEFGFEVEGDLTVHEVTLPVTFDARATLDDDTLSGVLTTRKLI